MKTQKLRASSIHRSPSLDQINAANRNTVMMDEYSDDEDEFQMPDQEECSTSLGTEVKKTEEECTGQIDLSCFSGNLRRDNRDNGRDCWRISNANNFRVRSKNFCSDKSKVPAGKHLMELVAVDWFKDIKRMDHVARRSGCAARSINSGYCTDFLSDSVFQT
ncbi:pleckstrin homology (PH) domain-containing protein [Actinidia rufa]|uniref:Pleckstrin homology (PH) domain-containing protein n=1 Tax=Actinidia rufa TaxID=165716 RepID=A0A7J0GZS7_9ERIC|nr:pleckstrin homology (PH) domain-containing protein [Actinidia rufa]